MDLVLHAFYKVITAPIVLRHRHDGPWYVVPTDVSVCQEGIWGEAESCQRGVRRQVEPTAGRGVFARTKKELSN